MSEHEQHPPPLSEFAYMELRRQVLQGVVVDVGPNRIGKVLKGGAHDD